MKINTPESLIACDLNTKRAACIGYVRQYTDKAVTKVNPLLLYVLKICDENTLNMFINSFNITIELIRHDQLTINKDHTIENRSKPDLSAVINEQDQIVLPGGVAFSAKALNSALWKRCEPVHNQLMDDTYLVALDDQTYHVERIQRYENLLDYKKGQHRWDYVVSLVTEEDEIDMMQWAFDEAAKQGKKITFNANPETKYVPAFKTTEVITISNVQFRKADIESGVYGIDDIGLFTAMSGIKYHVHRQHIKYDSNHVGHYEYKIVSR